MCQEITQGELTDYPITLVGSSTVKICSERICDVQANKICVLCENIYCKLCAKVISTYLKCKIGNSSN